MTLYSSGSSSSSSSNSSVSSIGNPLPPVTDEDEDDDTILQKYAESFFGPSVRESKQPLVGDGDKMADDGMEMDLITGSTQSSPEHEPRDTNESSPLRTTDMNSADAAADAGPQQQSSCPMDHHDYSTQYFRDQLRRVDYVLVYTKFDDSEPDSKDALNEQKHRAKRHCFEENLVKQGLDLELETMPQNEGMMCFLKVHGPWEFMAKQAELLHIKMPIGISDVRKPTKSFRGIVDKAWTSITRDLSVNEAKYGLDTADYFTAPFVAERAHQFLMPDKEHFFSSSQRSRMVYDILIRTGYDDARPDRVGVERLIANGSYTGAYPLHEGDAWRIDSGLPVESAPTDRQVLYETWADPKKFYKYQPLDLIRKYFGEKVSLYFAWLGFYTSVLIPASLIGLICVIYGALTMHSEYYPGTQMCDPKIAGNFTMCPLCDVGCGFWKLKESCTYAMVTHVFDNTATVVFAVFMSIWATMFIEGWKRYLAELSWKWDLFDFELQEERIRPEFQTKVKGQRINPITHIKEPYLTTKEKIMRWIASGATVVFFLCLVMAFVIGVVIYRVIINRLLNEDERTQKMSKWITSATAATLNLICIILLGRFYQALAWKLTNWERPRTETEFENSYTFKVFLFQFINYYSSLFYIAFFKGKLSNLPGGKKTEQLFGTYQWEACDPAGCMVELVIQLGIIMVGKQFFNNFMEILFPILWNWWRKRSVEVDEVLKEGNEEGKLPNDPEDESEHRMPQWEKDYTLNAVPDDYMFNEYLEMVIQFGFVTLFVAAFPLAPLFALLNNAMEVRLDAYKFVVAYRRPQPARSKDLGIWSIILDGLSKLAVLTNACVIAFTSDFVPRVLYVVVHGTQKGFCDWSLSYFNTSTLPDVDTLKQDYDGNADVCRWKDFRKPPCGLHVDGADITRECGPGYKVSLEWWHVLAARLCFVLVFEHFVFVIKGLVAYMIPDLPTDIFVKLQREQYLSRQARNKFELQKEKPKPKPKTKANHVDIRVSAPSPSVPESDEEGSEGFYYSPRQSFSGSVVTNDSRQRIATKL